MHEVLVNRLEDLSLPRKSVVRLTDRPDLTLDFTVDVKHQCNNNNNNNSILVISGRLEVDNEGLCAMERFLLLRRFRLEGGSNSVR